MPRVKKKNKSTLIRRKRATEEAAERKRLEQAVTEISDADLSFFSEFPLSKKTVKGLTEAGFVKPTPIQQATIGLGLRGCDVLGAAKTGSGKTLAFLIPLVEKLWRLCWSKLDGVGAVVISPTRELALQTFKCLSSFGKEHEMSAGLIIGGTTFEREQANISHTNILICTPGRLLQHMDETPIFDCMTVQVLVLDEADRILDLGFAKALDAIVCNMPPTRQTLLFSATQTQSVKDLARLSLKNPQIVSTDKSSAKATPDKLVEVYTICELHDKLTVLFSFIKSHLQCKILVFMSSCKQVRFVYESFRRFRPGMPLMHLFGRQKQAKRLAIFNDFSKKKEACLFATDIAARGLDFPSVDWVLQFDCPEDVDTYIHRVGRTARYNQGGKGMLLLLPSEAPGMIALMEKRRIQPTETKIAPNKLIQVTPMVQSLCASDPDLKYLAQKCFVSYTRSVYLQANKEIFDVQKLGFADYAQSLGLLNTPKIKFLKKMNAEKLRGKQHLEEDVMPGELSNDEGQSDNDTEFDIDYDNDDDPKNSEIEPKKKTKFDALRFRKNQGVLAPHRLAMREEDDDDDDANDLFTLSKVQRHEQLDEAGDEDAKKAISTKKAKKAKTVVAVKKTFADAKGSHLKFKDDGSTINERERLVGINVKDKKAVRKALAEEKDAVDLATKEMRTVDVLDKEEARKKLRQKKLDRKRKLKELLRGGDEEIPLGVQLGPTESDEEQFSDSADSSPQATHEDLVKKLLGVD
eukprot:m.270430 g.270430  ORF g.270430 m.270430 type:complete len:748 (-) comp16263_c9_seq1:1527-3770(-)